MPTLNTTTLGRFCRELAGGLDDLPTLLNEWGVSQDQFEQLQRSPAFAHEMRVVQAEMQEMGNDAGFVYRMKSLMENLLPDFVSMVTDKSLAPSQRFEMMKWAAEMGRLKEKPAPRGEFSGPRGPTVVFKFGPGLPVQSMTVHPGENTEKSEVAVIDVQPQPVDSSGWPL